MPLPPSVARDELHGRLIALRGFRRIDGWYDVEARLTDTKTEAMTVGAGRVVAPGEPVHDMWVRLVVDADFNVKEVVAATDAAPHGICGEASATLQCLRGLRIGPGWSKAVRARLAGRNGCTHLSELLGPLATVAFQTLSLRRAGQPAAVDADGVPRKVDSCYAYARERELVRQRWPLHYKGIDGN
jgi:hypothetical protein